MALATQVTISVLDAKGKAGTLQIYLNPTAALASQLAYVSAFCQRLDPITAGRIDAAYLAIPVPLNGLGLKASPASSADRQEKYTLRFRDSVNMGRVQYSIPAINRAMTTRVIGGGAYAILDLLQDEPNEFIDLQTRPQDNGQSAGIFVSARGDVLDRVAYSRMTYKAK